MAYMLARRNNLQNPFNQTCMVGKKWLMLFLNRVKEKLSIRRPTDISFARASGFDNEKLDAFLTLLEENYTKNNHPSGCPPILGNKIP